MPFVFVSITPSLRLCRTAGFLLAFNKYSLIAYYVPSVVVPCFQERMCNSLGGLALALASLLFVQP